MGFMGLGELPKEYNRKIHGPYDPAVFYGKSESSFNSVRVHVKACMLSVFSGKHFFVLAEN
jgi:hypothetical protein